jgi:polysaccharide export outer membrane protein
MRLTIAWSLRFAIASLAMVTLAMLPGSALAQSAGQPTCPPGTSWSASAGSCVPTSQQAQSTQQQAQSTQTMTYPSAPQGNTTGSPSGVGGVLSGTGITPGQAVAIAKSLSPQELGAIAAKLGMSPDQLQALQSSLANGTLSQGQIDALSARLGAQGIGPDQIQQLGPALGLSPDQINQLQGNLSRIQSGTAMTPAQQAAAVPSPGAQPTTAAKAPPSAIENIFRNIDTAQQQVPEFTGPEELEQFGYNFFTSPANAQSLNISPNVPVGPDYVVGPGDQLQLMMWGTRNETDILVVNRDGAVEVPSIGPIQVAGLKFDRARQVIESKVEQITGVHAAVTMGQIRTITVFVVGDVTNPGPYTVNSLARVTDALVAAGGPTKVGTLRRIQLKRGNQLVRTIDLYDVLLRGDTSADVRLEDRDVVFVPPIGAVTGIAGNLKRPGIYELGGRQETLSQVLSLAGGTDPFAYTQRIQIERVDNHQRRVILDTTLDKLGDRRFTVSDGDLVKVFPVLPEQKNRVSLVGNVYRPGDYQWHPGMKFSDLVSMGEGVQPRTYFQYALVKRLEGKELYPHYLPVNLGQALDHPASAADIPLQPLDTVTIYNQDDLRNLPTVTVTGEVRIPGTYRLDPNMKVSDLIYLAGGLTEAAYQKSAELARTEVVDGTVTRHQYIDVDLRSALDRDHSSDLVLAANDQLFIRSATNWHLPWTVTVGGRIARPGAYTIHEGEHLSSLIEQAGGFLPDAFPQGMIFTRQAVQKAQQTELDKARLDLQQQLAQATLTQASLTTASATSGSGASASTTAMMASMQQLLASSAGLQATGRVVVRWKGSKFVGPDDLLLEDKDSIMIPRQPSSVSIIGQVYNPTAVIARPELTVRNYLDLAGGPTQMADTDHIYIIKADGNVMTSEGYRDMQRSHVFPMLPLISGGLDSATLNAGDTVYVPYKIPDFTNLTITKDITQIIAQSAQAMAVVGILATNI